MKKYLFQLLRSIFFFYTLSANVPAFGNPTNYYFSTSIGNDSRTSTQAQSPATPWKTLSKLNSFFASVKPGDSILLKRGEEYPGSITISSSGTSSLPIVIGAYGSGAKPVITGFATVSAWTSLGRGIWESSSAISTLSVCNVVTINNIMKAMGRYPNDDAANRGYLTYQSHSGTTSIMSSQISGIPNFVGGELVLRFNRSSTDRCIITEQTSTTVTYTPQSGNTPQNGYGFFFENSPNLLDKFGEWYYNPSTHKLRVFLGSSSSYAVKASVVDTLVKASSKSYTTLDNISLQGANTDAVSVYGGSNFTIKNCDILYSGRDAVRIAATTGFKVDKCYINYSNNRGINGFQTNTTAQTITNNIIRNTGMFPGMGWKNSYNGVLIGIEANTKGSVIENNKVINAGYHGIRFYGDSTVVKNNYVDSFCINKDDGGGIYTWNGSDATHTGIKVQNNIVLHGIGAPEGSNSIDREAQGIYIDDNANGIEVTGNTVANCRKGVFLHNGRNIVLSDNTFYNNAYASIKTGFNDGPGITGCKIMNNIFFAKLSTQLCTYLTSMSNDIDNIGTFDSNYYCRPIFEPNGIKTSSSTTGGIIRVSTSGTTYYSLDTWKTSYGKDAHSHKTAITVADTNKIDFKYNATNISKTISLSGTWMGVDGKSYSGSIKLAPHSSIILIKRNTSLKGSSNTAEVQSSDAKFRLKAQPNPSTSYFNLLVQSSRIEPILIKVTDLEGKILEIKTGIEANGTLQLGNNLKPGIYIIEAIQGKEKVQLKVTKI